MHRWLIQNSTDSVYIDNGQVKP